MEQLSAQGSIRHLRIDAQQPVIPLTPSACKNHLSTHVTHVVTIVTLIALHWFRTHWSIPKSCGLREFCQTHIGFMALGRSCASHKRTEESRKVRTAETWRILWVGLRLACGLAEPVYSVESCFPSRGASDRNSSLCLTSQMTTGLACTFVRLLEVPRVETDVAGVARRSQRHAQACQWRREPRLDVPCDWTQDFLRRKSVFG